MYWIWVKRYDGGKPTYTMRYWQCYVRKGNAERIAKEWFKDHDTVTFETIVSETNPFKDFRG